MLTESIPFEIIEVDQDTSKILMKNFTTVTTGFVRVGPKGYFFPHKYKQEAADIYNIEIRPSDIFVTSYPRSGTTWVQDLVWMIANNLDYETSKTRPLIDRYYSLLEFKMLNQDDMREEILKNKDLPGWKRLATRYFSPVKEQLSSIPSPRFIKSHLPLSLLPPNILDAKVVYVARDPRDVAVSFFHLCRTTESIKYKGHFETFWNQFISDLCYWAPFFEHLKEAWEKRTHPNMLFLCYEDLKKDLKSVSHRVADFLKKEYDDQQIAKLSEYLSFKNFKENSSVNYNACSFYFSSGFGFIRKGKTGGWRDYFDEKMTAQAQKWIDDNLKDTDFRFPHLQ